MNILQINSAARRGANSTRVANTIVDEADIAAAFA